MKSLESQDLSPEEKKLLNILQIKLYDISQNVQIIGKQLTNNQIKDIVSQSYNISHQLKKIFEKCGVTFLYELQRKKPGLKGIRSRKRNRQVRLRKKLLKIIMCKIRLRNLIKKKSKNMKKRLSKFMKKSLKYVKWNTIKSKFLNPKLRKQHRWQKMIKKKKS